MSTLNKVFLDVFGEALTPLGFKRIKSKYPYFVRLIGDEIIHVITFKKTYHCPNENWLNILGGVATVYRQRITLSESPKDNTDWLNDNLKFHENSYPLEFDPVFRGSLFNFKYNESTMVDIVKHSLKITEKFMLPALNTAVNIDSCIEYFHVYSPFPFIRDYENFGNDIDGEYCNEWLLYMLTENYIELKERNMKRHNSIYAHNVKIGKHEHTQEELENRLKRYDEVKLREIAKRDKYIDDPQLYDKTLAEIEHRKATNIEILKSYGLDV
ncbi:MAG: hypothetical protein LBC86_03895 [Oscillospiraceae bacterium]|jgi:hypothetical protein|nr:hypothetical protein [Oscillospiraceae bacterium]